MTPALTDHDRLMTVAQVAVVGQVSPRSIRRLIASGALRHCRIGTSIRVRESQWAAYLAATNGVSTTATVCAREGPS